MSKSKRDKRDIFPPKSTAKQDARPKRKHPQGWEPGLEITEKDDATGYFEGLLIPHPEPYAEGSEVDPEAQPWDYYIARYGLDPKKVDVIPPIEIRFWEGYVKNEIVMEQGKVAAREGEPFHYEDEDLIVKTDLVYFKAKIVSKVKAAIEENEKKWIRSFKPLKRRPKASGERTLVVVWADWQIGKDDGDGVQGTVDRILDSFAKTVELIKKFKPSKVLVVSIGDMIENCTGYYPQQAARVEMNLREQEQTVRRLIVRGLKDFSDAAPAVEVLVVGGNHGENREEGKSFTDFADNFDVGVYEAVMDQLAENTERFNNIVFRIPQADLTQTIDEHGHVIGIFHGHQVSGRTITAMDKWIQQQAVARTAVGDADILVNGHFHHFYHRHLGPRHHLQAPTLDGGSEWFDQKAGGNEPAGTLVFTVDDDGLDNVRVLKAERTERPDKWSVADE